MFYKLIDLFIKTLVYFEVVLNFFTNFTLNLLVKILVMVVGGRV